MTTTVPDAVLASALDLARAALGDLAPAEQVGEHLEAVAEDELVVTHRFACLAPGYRGWAWAVTLTRVPGSELVTVCDTVLLPGSDALLAPQWLPWDERVRPGDLSPGDLYPTDPSDPRLEPGYTGSDALEPADDPTSDLAPLRPEQWELGLGREQVLSAYGRDVATERWWDDLGPDSAMAKAAPDVCSSCGFLLPMGGLVGQAFGVCANAFGADGRVVALAYGCGAHSSVRAVEGTGIPVTEIVVDDLGYEQVLDLRAGSPATSDEVVDVAEAADLLGRPEPLVDDDAIDVVDLSAADTAPDEPGDLDDEATEAGSGDALDVDDADLDDEVREGADDDLVDELGDDTDEDDDTGDDEDDEDDDVVDLEVDDFLG